MLEIFLSHPKTAALLIRDFAEWHQGITHYGFWAVAIENQDWMELFKQGNVHMEPFIHPAYIRGPHVTIAACGLLDETRFSGRLLRLQAEILKNAKFRPFHVTAGPMDSFTTAPYITVCDPTGELRRIRELLTNISSEDGAVPYQPHMTVGLYRDSFDTRIVAEHLQKFRHAQARPLVVTELAFCAYETKDVQGPFKILERFPLHT